MADLEVNTSSISSMQTTLEEAVESLESTLKAMYASVNDLNATWEGPNHDEFVRDFQNRYEQMQKLNQAFKSYSNSVKQANKIYRKCEDEVWQIVRGM